jgi:hypothetical protein
MTPGLSPFENGEAIREKIQSAMLSALQKGTNLGTTIQGKVTIRNAKFTDAGDGRLLLLLAGEARLSQEQLKLLTEQRKERLAH